MVSLLADPTGLDGAGQLLKRGVGRQVAQVAFALADQPDPLAGKMLLPKVTDALRWPVSNPHVILC